MVHVYKAKDEEKEQMKVCVRAATAYSFYGLNSKMYFRLFRLT